MAATDCKPFLKWVGGKGQLLAELRNRLPAHFNSYHEPFIGGGALFFALQPQNAHLSDINPELINCYQVVRDDVDELIEDLQKHIYEKDYFYKIRAADRTESFKDWTNIQKASRLIYLNKTCFNGLYRVNSKGQFNSPFGRYTNPTICNAENLRACSLALRSANIDLKSFEAVVDNTCLLYTSPSPRDKRQSRMPSSA